MGTTIDVVAGDHGSLSATRDLFTTLESRFSRFRLDSELNAINRDPGARVRLSPPMAEVMHRAAGLRELTDGLVDPAIGGRLRSWGYDRSFEEIEPVPTPPEDDGPVATWDVDGEWLHRPRGVEIDLGGIVKGWAADRAIELGTALLVSAGGDVRSVIDDAVVEIEDPHDGSVTPVELGIGGLATSSTARRRWSVGAADVHHIVDPRTGSPAVTPIVSATVRCDTAVEAEAAAKAVLLHGGAGLAWADRQDWIRSALVAWHDGSIYATHGWEYAA